MNNSTTATTTTTAHIVPPCRTCNTNDSFDQHWLPGISFDGNEDHVDSSAKTQTDTEMSEITPSLPPLQSVHQRISPVGSSSSSTHLTYPSRPLEAGNESSSRHASFACHELLETSHAPPILSELTEDDIRLLWWKNPELLQMKRFTRDLMVNGITEDDWVGLDRFTAERTAYKKRAVRLVLLAQHQQRTHAISDNPQEFIRAVSRRCSHWTRKMSLAIGYHLHGGIYTNVPNEERTAIATELRIEDEKITPPAPAISRTSPLEMEPQNKISANGNGTLNKRKRSAIELEVDSFAERMKGACVHPKR